MVINFAILIKRKKAGIAQLVEQRTENPRVGGSNPPPGISKYSALQPIYQVKNRLGFTSIPQLFPKSTLESK